MENTKYEGVYRRVRSIYTKNLVKGVSVYGEYLYKDNDGEFREWNPKKSKLGAALSNGIKRTGMADGVDVLYLGCASGTTVSHVSDIVGKKGIVFALDFAPRVLREMVFLAQQRGNIVPILADANKLPEVAKYVSGVDVLFQDVAQKNQVEIFIKNMHFVKKSGLGMLSVKSRSIDITKSPIAIYKMVEAELHKHFMIIDVVDLEPYEMDHCMFLVEKRAPDASRVSSFADKASRKKERYSDRVEKRGKFAEKKFDRKKDKSKKFDLKRDKKEKPKFSDSKRDDKRGKFSDRKDDRRGKRDDKRGKFSDRKDDRRGKRDDKRGKFSDRKDDRRGKRDDKRGKFSDRKDDKRGRFSSKKSDGKRGKSFSKKRGKSAPSSSFEEHQEKNKGRFKPRKRDDPMRGRRKPKSSSKGRKKKGRR